LGIDVYPGGWSAADPPTGGSETGTQLDNIRPYLASTAPGEVKPGREVKPGGSETGTQLDNIRPYLASTAPGALADRPRRSLVSKVFRSASAGFRFTISIQLGPRSTGVKRDHMIR
jgi:hypothetical protein